MAKIVILQFQNKQVLDILDKVKNKSEFICQAVIENATEVLHHLGRETLRKEIKVYWKK